MKKVLFGFLAILIIIATACNSNDKSAQNSDDKSINKDSAQNNTAQSDSNISVVTPTFANLDPKVSAGLKSVTDHYLHIKNALANDNEKEAQSGGKAMAKAIDQVDKSLMTADQKKVFEENQEDLKEHAEHISESPIDHQREHFAMMSEEVYALVKAYGSGRTLYHDHCPMYNDKKGALWLSETIEIKNPYMGTKMPKCGKVQEKIQ